MKKLRIALLVLLALVAALAGGSYLLPSKWKVERSLVICLPGKPSGAVECLGFVVGAIPHCVEVLQEVPTSC